MVQPSPDSQSTIRRFLLREQKLIAAVGEFAPLEEAYLAHARRWDMPLDPLGQVMMRQALGGAALQLAIRPREESIGWTINVARPARNIFVTGHSWLGTVSGRLFTEGVDDSQGGRLFVQTSRRGGEASTSTIAIEGLDVLVFFEQYFRDSVQLPTRFLELSDTRLALVQGLPDADRARLDALDREEVERLITLDPTEELDSKPFRLECGCTPEKVAGALVQFWGERPDELFQGEEGVEAKCPRCGARYWVDRPFFERVRRRP